MRDKKRIFGDYKANFELCIQCSLQMKLLLARFLHPVIPSG